jgi:hypothetical protein
VGLSNLGKGVVRKTSFPLTVERSAEAAEPVSKARVKHSAPRESLGVAHCRFVSRGGKLGSRFVSSTPTAPSRGSVPVQQAEAIKYSVRDLFPWLGSTLPGGSVMALAKGVNPFAVGRSVVTSASPRQIQGFVTRRERTYSDEGL